MSPDPRREPERRILGAPITKTTIRETEESPPVSNRSMWPASLHKEAGQKVPLSLGFVGALMWGAYQLGAQRATDAETIVKSVAELKSTVDQAAKDLEKSRTECGNSVKSITVIEGRIASMQAELVTISSKLEKR